MYVFSWEDKMLIRICAFVFFLSALVSSSQISPYFFAKGNFLTSKDEQPVYISFERLSEKSITNQNGEKTSIKVVWLRLHNNTKCAISVLSDGILQDESISYKKAKICNGVVDVVQEGSKESLIYEIVGDTNKIKQSHGHIMTSGYIWVSSGHSLIFNVPQEHLGQKDYIKIYVNYEEEWEWKGDSPIKILGKQHLIPFYGADLPFENKGAIKSPFVPF
jgi:hypothetical protein